MEYIIYTATIPGALTGADVAIFAAAFAYISDVSTVNNRTIRVTILDVCYLITMPIGVALGMFEASFSLNHRDEMISFNFLTFQVHIYIIAL